jgi:uncharacterized protein DUF1905
MGDRSSESAYPIQVNFEFSGEVWYWRGPAPFHFVTVPDHHSQDIKDISGFVTYGWGMIPAKIRIGRTEWTTALWPKNGRYVVPLKDAVRNAERLELGDKVTVHLEVLRREA